MAWAIETALVVRTWPRSYTGQLESFMEKFHGGIHSEADLQERWDALALGDLTGKRVLDVGAAEGWFSRRCVEAGADVVAVEPVREVAEGAAATIIGTRFDGDSGLVPIIIDRGPYDVVLMLRVLYHARIPQLMLMRAAEALVSGGVLYLESWFADQDGPQAVLIYHEDEPDGWRFEPTAPALRAMLRQYGFSKPEVIYSYQSGTRQIWRMSKI